MSHIPKVILLDAGDRIHSTDFCPRTDQFDSDVGADLDYRVLIVRELGRSCVWIKFDVRWNELILMLDLPSTWTLILTCEDTKSGRGPASAKKPILFTDVTMAST
jgi:hypothetical protein